MQWENLSIKRSERRARRKASIKDWHLWFAWRPVRIGRSTVWLETVQRRLAGVYRTYEGVRHDWRYRFAWEDTPITPHSKTPTDARSKG